MVHDVVLVIVETPMSRWGASLRKQILCPWRRKAERSMERERESAREHRIAGFELVGERCLSVFHERYSARKESSDKTTKQQKRVYIFIVRCSPCATEL